MGTSTANPASNRRSLMVRDGLFFLALLGTSIALFGVTLFLFRSFQTHREDLAEMWSARGRAAMHEGRPGDAVTALRTALSYAPDDDPGQLLLAEALAEAGRTEEADNYFMTLWDEKPGDGFINLQLARLGRKKGEIRDAEERYRASIFGSWDRDGDVRRREVRLEFTDFLIHEGQLSEARNQLFTVAGNAPNDPAVNLLVGQKFQAALDLQDALVFDEKAVEEAPRSRPALEAAGSVAYAVGDFGKADTLLTRSLEQDRRTPEDETRTSRIVALQQAARSMIAAAESIDQKAKKTGKRRARGSHHGE